MGRINSCPAREPLYNSVDLLSLLVYKKVLQSISGLDPLYLIRIE